MSTPQAYAAQNIRNFENIVINQVNIEGLMIGGQPQKRDLEKIRKLGFKTVITLRPENEDANEVNFDEEAEAKKLGFNFVRIPIVDSSDLTDKNIQALDTALKMADGKAFVHCRTGNRVGAMLALRAFRIQNISYPEALALGKKAGLNTMQPDVETVMGTRKVTQPLHSLQNN